MPLQHAESNQTVGWLVETEGEREEGRGVSVRRLVLESPCTCLCFFPSNFCSLSLKFFCFLIYLFFSLSLFFFFLFFLFLLVSFFSLVLFRVSGFGLWDSRWSESQWARVSSLVTAAGNDGWGKSRRAMAGGGENRGTVMQNDGMLMGESRGRELF